MTEVVSDLTPIFPHEDIELFQAHTEQGSPSLMRELGQFAVFAKLHLQVEHTLDPEACAQAFTVANGETGATIFSNKFRFGDFVRELGYLAPQSVIVEPEGAEKGMDYRSEIDSLDEQPQRFCKPLYSTRGRRVPPRFVRKYIIRPEVLHELRLSSRFHRTCTIDNQLLASVQGR